MANLYIEDKYYETKLPDGSIMFTRTRHIVNALLYYKQQCYDIIEKGNKTISSTPKIMAVNSFEEAMQKINRLTDTKSRIVKAEKMIERIDGILRKMAEKSSQPNLPEGEQGFGK